jgi:hypothetical protein
MKRSDAFTPNTPDTRDVDGADLAEEGSKMIARRKSKLSDEDRDGRWRVLVFPDGTKIIEPHRGRVPTKPQSVKIYPSRREALEFFHA